MRIQELIPNVGLRQAIEIWNEQHGRFKPSLVSQMGELTPEELRKEKEKLVLQEKSLEAKLNELTWEKQKTRIDLMRLEHALSQLPEGVAVSPGEARAALFGVPPSARGGALHTDTAAAAPPVRQGRSLLPAPASEGGF